MNHMEPFHVWCNISKVDSNAHIIGGYASVDIVDNQNDKIPISTLKDTWNHFVQNLDYARVHILHSNIPVGKILTDYTDSDGRKWISGVDETGLFILAEIRDDIRVARDLWGKIESKEFRAFSIGGEVLASSMNDKGNESFTNIDSLELHEVSVVDKPANSLSLFTIMKRSKKADIKDESKETSQPEVELNKEDRSKEDMVKKDLETPDTPEAIIQLAEVGKKVEGLEAKNSDLEAKINELEAYKAEKEEAEAKQKKADEDSKVAEELKEKAKEAEKPDEEEEEEKDKKKPDESAKEKSDEDVKVEVAVVEPKIDLEKVTETVNRLVEEAVIKRLGGTTEIKKTEVATAKKVDETNPFLMNLYKLHTKSWSSLNRGDN